MKTSFRRGAVTFLALALFVAIAAPHTASAASLTEPQIQAILNLLVAFDVPQATINNVTIILHGGSPSAADPQALQIDDHIRGSAHADVVIIEYCDTESLYCKTFHSTLRMIYDHYKNGGRVAWVYRNFPLKQLFSKSEREAQAIECAAHTKGEDTFWAYVDRLYEVTPSEDGLDPAELVAIAQEVGISRSAFENCLDTGAGANKVTRDYGAGVALGVQGTPSSVLVGKNFRTRVEGARSYADIKSEIDSLLNK